ncbi:MAG TPA: amidohydrolase family protein [Terriglobales bacterium]
MRIRSSFLIALTVLLALSFNPTLATAQGSAECLYNDIHFHIQNFIADGPPLSQVLQMMDQHVCRSTIMGLPVTVAHDPLVDRDFAPVYYTQTDGQAMYFNPIQDVIVAHKYLALPENDRTRVDPMMSAFNLKDARAGDYIKKMVLLYPGVWSGFGEIIFKKQEFSEKIAGGPPSLYSPSIDAIFDVIGEMGAVAIVHCDHDTPYNLALRSDPGASMIFQGVTAKPQYLEAFKAFLKRHPNAPMIWAHFMGNGRGVLPYPDHWRYLDEMLGDPAFGHVYIDLSWGPVIAPYIIDNPQHLKMTADLIRKYPDRFLYGSDRGATAEWDSVKGSYTVWDPLWKEIGPALTRQVTKDNYIRLIDQSRRNMRAWEKAHPEKIE